MVTVKLLTTEGLQDTDSGALSASEIDAPSVLLQVGPWLPKSISAVPPSGVTGAVSTSLLTSQLAVITKRAWTWPLTTAACASSASNSRPPRAVTAR